MDYNGTKASSLSFAGKLDTEDGTLTPVRLGYNCWTVDPTIAQASRAVNAGTLYLMAVRPSASAAAGSTVQVEVPVTTAGVTLTLGKVGLYVLSGGVSTLVGQSGDVKTQLSSPNTFNAGVVLTTGFQAGDSLYIALLAVGTTGPNLMSTYVGNNAAKGQRMAQVTGVSALPATVTMTATTAPSTLFFLAF